MAQDNTIFSRSTICLRVLARMLARFRETQREATAWPSWSLLQGFADSPPSFGCFRYGIRHDSLLAPGSVPVPVAAATTDARCDSRSKIALWIAPSSTEKKTC